MTSRSSSFQGEVCDAPKSNKKSKGTNWKHAKLLLEAGAAVFHGFEFRNLSAQNEGRFKLFILRIAHVDHLHQRLRCHRGQVHEEHIYHVISAIQNSTETSFGEAIYPTITNQESQTTVHRSLWHLVASSEAWKSTAANDFCWLPEKGWKNGGDIWN